MASVFAFVAGLAFGLGLIVAGMANPAKILGFLDIAGKWDPSLAFVMVGAIAVGPGAFALGAGYMKAGVFVVAMLLGMGAYEFIERMRSESRTPDASGA